MNIFDKFKGWLGDSGEALNAGEGLTEAQLNESKYEELGAMGSYSDYMESKEVKNQDALETKSVYGATGGYSSGVSFAEYLYNSGYQDLSAYAAICMYKKAMPLFNAISMRAESMAQIPVVVKEENDDQTIVEDHPALELLKKPNADVSQQEFMEQLASFYDICGEVFIIATGPIRKAPLELVVVGPQLITFSKVSEKFGILNLPEKIHVTRQLGQQLTFYATEYPDMGVRYVTKEEDAEIWHIRAFNPLRSSTNFRGLSRAQPIWMEIQQYISGNANNLSNLKRGTRLSMAWVNPREVELTETQWERMQEEAQKYAGDANAGGTPILDGMDVKTIQQTNRDMQFKDLQEAMLARVSSTYRVPLALLLPATMTLNNLQTSLLMLFDTGVLPLTSRLYNELSRFLMPRYDNSENLEFAYNENDISALRIRILESAKLLSEIDVNTIDEIRNVLGDKPLDNGAGDVVFRQSTLIPVGEEFGSDDIDNDDLTTDDF